MALALLMSVPLVSWATAADAMTATDAMTLADATNAGNSAAHATWRMCNLPRICCSGYGTFLHARHHHSDALAPCARRHTGMKCDRVCFA
jgi:hypothetical protein